MLVSNEGPDPASRVRANIGRTGRARASSGNTGYRRVGRHRCTRLSGERQCHALPGWPRAWPRLCSRGDLGTRRAFVVATLAAGLATVAIGSPLAHGAHTTRAALLILGPPTLPTSIARGVRRVLALASATNAKPLRSTPRTLLSSLLNLRPLLRFCFFSCHRFHDSMLWVNAPVNAGAECSR